MGGWCELREKLIVERAETTFREGPPIARPLTSRGTIAAALVGGLTLTAGWAWAVLLIGWFISVAGLTALGREQKRARTRSMLPDEEGRGARQVFANGGIFAIAALAQTITGDARFGVAALGALAAATADTWATEIGLLLGGAPYGVLTGRQLEPGTSGGVTPIGNAAAVAGALAVAFVGAACLQLAPAGTSRTPAQSGGLLIAIAGAGVLGSVVDTIIGATVQARRRCLGCDAWTERKVHSCGSATRHARGIRFITNDVVNLLATLTGAVTALLLIT